MKDGLPKQKDVPKEMGGSGVLIGRIDPDLGVSHEQCRSRG